MLLINIGLVVLCALSVLIFVFYSNRVVSEKYAVNLLQRQLNKASVDLDLINADIERVYNIESLTAYAKSTGMVEAKEMQSIFENGSVALGTANRN